MDPAQSKEGMQDCQHRWPVEDPLTRESSTGLIVPALPYHPAFENKKTI